MAKLNPLFLLVVGVVLAFLILLLSSSGIVPYNGDKRNYAEAMTTTSSPNATTPMNQTSNTVSTDTNSNANSSSLGNFLSSVSNALPSAFSKENFEPILEEPRTVHYGVFRDSEIIDKFSQVTVNGVDGANGCVSSGLTNSGGYICLTPELVNLLKTRGGNASGR